MADTPITVTRAAPTLNTPTTTSVLDRAISVTAASLQPTTQTVAFALVMGLTSAAVQPVANNVNLDWQRPSTDWTISVGAATLTPQLYAVEGRRGIPVGTAIPTLSGNEVNLAYRKVFVDVTALSPVGQDLGLEENHFFDRAAPVIAGQNIGLSKGTPVVSATPTIAAQTITLTLGAAPVFAVDSATPTLACQDVALNWNFAVAPASSAFSIIGQNIGLQWQINNGISIDPAVMAPAGQTIVLDRSQIVSSTALSVAGQSIGFKYDWSLPVTVANEEAGLSISGQEIGLSFSFTLGTVVTPATLSVSAQDVGLFLGSGAPTIVKISQTAPSIQIGLGAPITTTSSSENTIV